MPSDHNCCAEELRGDIKDVLDSQARVEEQAKHVWNPAAEQTWKTKKEWERFKGALQLAGIIIGSGGVLAFIAWLVPRVAGGA